MNLEKKKLYESQRLMELNKEIVSNQIQKKLDKKSK